MFNIQINAKIDCYLILNFVLYLYILKLTVECFDFGDKGNFIINLILYYYLWNLKVEDCHLNGNFESYFSLKAASDLSASILYRYSTKLFTNI